MGLDQYLYKVTDVNKYNKIKKELEEKEALSDKLTDEIFNEFKIEASKEISELKNYLQHLQEKYPKLTIEKEKDYPEVKLFQFIRFLIEEKNPEDYFEQIEFNLFNYFPLIMFWVKDEIDKDSIEFKKEVTKKFISIAKKAKENISSNLINKFKKEIKLLRDLEKSEEELSELKTEIMYWRKANQIHNWFKRNVEWKVEPDIETKIFNGKTLLKLIEDCEKVEKILRPYYEKDPNFNEIDEADLKKVLEIISPTKGFFFGSTDIDCYYYNDIKNTIEELKDNIKENNHYYYLAWY